jgi:hypothetical protein
MRRRIAAAATTAAVLLGGAAVADMRDAFNKQQKATDYLNSCLHYDKAQWQSYYEGRSKKSLGNERVLVRPDKTLLFTEEDLFYFLDKRLQESGVNEAREKLREQTGLLPRRQQEPAKRECRARTPFHGARKMGNYTHLYSDGSGDKNLTVVEGDFLVTYSSGCLKWKCSSFVSRYVIGVRIGSPSYEAMK